jgi:hypothetical protein
MTGTEGTEQAIEAASSPGASDTRKTISPEPQIISDDFIGRALKAHFDDIASTPVPDKFLVLLAQLEAKEQSHGQ